MKTGSNFWNQHPALLYGIAGWVGIAAALFPSALPLCCAALAVLALTCCYSPARLFLALSLALTCFFCAKARHQIPNQIEERLAGVAELELEQIKQFKTPFGTQWLYQGTLLGFIPSGGEASIAGRIPIALSLPIKQPHQRPAAGYRYLIKGVLKQDAQGSFRLQPVKGTAWKRVQALPSLAEWRYSMKSTFLEHLKKVYPDPTVAAFIAGLATGAYDDRLLSYELNRFGLLHLMAISGLHFALLAAFLFFGCSLLFSRKIAAAVVLLLLSAYFIFLGSSPSVFRAWIAVLIALSALFLQRQAQGLNSLGVALLAAIFWNPFWINQIGFQFSFLITASILLFTAPCEALLAKLFPKRQLAQMVQLGWADQHGYCLLALIRKGIALALAVNLTALPLTLYHFHKFPITGLAYNLFFPFLVSLCIMLLMVALACALIFPWLGNLLHALNAAYTQSILGLVYHLPKSFDYNLYFSTLTTEVITGYLILLFTCGIFLSEQFNDKNDITIKR